MLELKKSILKELIQFLIWFFATLIILLIISILNILFTSPNIVNDITILFSDLLNISNYQDPISYLILSLPYLFHIFVRLALYLLFKIKFINEYPKKPYKVTLLLFIVILFFHFTYSIYSDRVYKKYFNQITNVYRPQDPSIIADSSNFKSIKWKRLSDFDHGAFWFETIEFKNDSLLLIKLDVKKTGYFFPILDLLNLNDIDLTFTKRYKLKNNLLIPDTIKKELNFPLDTLVFRNGNLKILYGY